MIGGAPVSDPASWALGLPSSDSWFWIGFEKIEHSDSVGFSRINWSPPQFSPTCPAMAGSRRSVGEGGSAAETDGSTVSICFKNSRVRQSPTDLDSQSIARMPPPPERRAPSPQDRKTTERGCVGSKGPAAAHGLQPAHPWRLRRPPDPFLHSAFSILHCHFRAPILTHPVGQRLSNPKNLFLKITAVKLTIHLPFQLIRSSRGLEAPTKTGFPSKP